MKVTLGGLIIMVHLENEQDAITTRDILQKCSVADLVEWCVHTPLLKEKVVDLEKRLAICNQSLSAAPVENKIKKSKKQ